MVELVRLPSHAQPNPLACSVCRQWEGDQSALTLGSRDTVASQVAERVTWADSLPSAGLLMCGGELCPPLFFSGVEADVFSSPRVSCDLVWRLAAETSLSVISIHLLSRTSVQQLSDVELSALHHV